MTWNFFCNSFLLCDGKSSQVQPLLNDEASLGINSGMNSSGQFYEETFDKEFALKEFKSPERVKPSACRPSIHVRKNNIQLIVYRTKISKGKLHCRETEWQN